jgi:hypothetical protein
MRSTASAHRAHPWRVHTLAPDFELVDVWRFDVQVDSSRGFDAFLDTFWEVMGTLKRHPLSRLRVAVGRVLGWDEKPNSRAIPGCRERAVAERLDATDRANSASMPGAGANSAWMPRAGADSASGPALPPATSVRPVYRFSDEALYEISNETVHALMHLGCGEDGVPELAVYIKSRGLFTRLYMAAIRPARHAIIYPALTSRVESRWRALGRAV